MNFWSQSEISVVRRRLSSASRSAGRGSGSFLWCSHHSKTFLRTLDGTLGNGMGLSDSPTSANSLLGQTQDASSKTCRRVRAFDHVLDENRAIAAMHALLDRFRVPAQKAIAGCVRDRLVDLELLVVGAASSTRSSLLTSAKACQPQTGSERPTLQE